MPIKDKINELKNNITTLYLCLKDNRTPIIAKILAFMIVCYALSPIDLIPDFIPIIGYLDDLLILPILIILTLKLIPKDIFLENKKKAYNLKLENKWYYSLPIILIWLLIIIIIIK